LCSRYNLAYAYELAGRLGEAIRLSEQNLADSVRLLGQDLPQTRQSRDNLACAYESVARLGRRDAASLMALCLGYRSSDGT